MACRKAACGSTSSDSLTKNRLVETANGIVPVEAKAERNLQAKSLGVYREKFSPQLALRTSLSDPKSDRGLVDVPLYAFGPRVLRLATPLS